MFKKSIVKTKVDPKIAISITVLAILIVGSFVIAAIAPSSGLGNFYAGSGDIDLPPSPPLGCCDWRKGPTFETKDNCKDMPRSEGWFPLSQSESMPAGSPVVEGNDCEIKCPSDTTTCGDWCCAQGQICTSKAGVQFCTAAICPPEAPKLCKAETRNTCCKNTDVCGVTTLYKLGVPVAQVATCVPPDTGCKSGDPNYCGTIKSPDGKSDVNVCCNPPTTNCNATSGIPTCLPSSCDSATQDMCVGGGFQICCPKNTCAYQPGNNTPFCNIKF